jgi:N-acetylglucosamine-6-phosphate deacetylase
MNEPDRSPTSDVVFTGANVVAPEGVIRNGWLSVREGVIHAVGKTDPPPGIVHDVRQAGGVWLVPGFIDLHCHGGGGGSFLNGDLDEARTAAEYHRKNGTTTLVASLISSPHEHLVRSARSLSRLARENGTVVGIHLEGPYLAHTHCGAHDPKHLRTPSTKEVAELLRAADGMLRQMTFAPELPGALELLDQLVEANVRGAIGHTGATAEQTRAAIDRGACLATHLCNAMPALHHRRGGPVIEIMNDERVFVELINDGVHLDSAFVRHLVKSIGAHRICMITDAVSAAGEPNGRYKLGNREIDLVNGVVRLATPEAPLAGSALTMAEAFANTAALTGSLVSAARMCSTTPSHVLGLRDRGALVRQRRADLVILSNTLAVIEVWQEGVRVFHVDQPQRIAR